MSKNKDTMTPEHWARIKAISWRPFRVSRFPQPFARFKTHWAGRVLGNHTSTNLNRDVRRDFDLTHRQEKRLRVAVHLAGRLGR